MDKPLVKKPNGRPKLPPHLVRVKRSIRVQRWVKEWLEEAHPDQMGEAVEDALKKAHRLKPPK